MSGLTGLSRVDETGRTPTEAYLYALASPPEQAVDDAHREVAAIRVLDPFDRTTKRALANAAKAHKRAQRAEGIIAAHVTRGFELEHRLSRVTEQLRLARRNTDAARRGRPGWIQRPANTPAGHCVDQFAETPNPWSIDSLDAARRISGTVNGRHMSADDIRPRFASGGIITGGKRPSWWPRPRHLVNRAHRLTPLPKPGSDSTACPAEWDAMIARTLREVRLAEWFK
jgi:hypothetical protein